MSQEYLSNIELYFSDDVADNYIQMSEEESKHITKVMRHSVGDKIFVTNGKGNIFKSEIIETCATSVTLRIMETFQYKNKLNNITFCIPRLKSNDRFEFAIEKCVELGITNFIVFDSERTVAKGGKLDRWNKIALSAMKQSLRSYLPTIEFFDSLAKVPFSDGKKLVFDQSGKYSITELLKVKKEGDHQKLNFIFGPEGGLTSKEIKLLNNSEILSLTSNRLRSETAIVTAASQIAISTKN